MPENTPNNPTLEISEEIGIQRYKTVVTPANKLFEAFFKEMEKRAIPCQRCSYFAFMFTNCLFNAQNVFGSEHKGRTEVSFATELRRMGKLLKAYM